jgi:hypothetical protein
MKAHVVGQCTQTDMKVRVRRVKLLGREFGIVHGVERFLDIGQIRHGACAPVSRETHVYNRIRVLNTSSTGKELGGDMRPQRGRSCDLIA